MLPLTTGPPTSIFNLSIPHIQVTQLLHDFQPTPSCAFDEVKAHSASSHPFLNNSIFGKLKSSFLICPFLPIPAYALHPRHHQKQDNTQQPNLDNLAQNYYPNMDSICQLHTIVCMHTTHPSNLATSNCSARDFLIQGQHSVGLMNY